MRFRSLKILLCLLAFILPLLSHPATAGNAVIASTTVSCDPASQGIGGTVAVTGTGDVWGACCGVTEARNIEATLSVPQQITILEGSNPQKIPDIVVPPGKGGSAIGTWKVKCESLGTYRLEVKIISENAGTAIGFCDLIVVGGPVISSPAIYPEKPTPNKETRVYVNITSVSGIGNATLCYSTSGTWTKVKMQNFGTELWMGTVPKQNEGKVLYYVEVFDSKGNSSKSPVSSFNVVNYGRIDAWISDVIIGTVLVFLLGLVIMFWIYLRFIRKRIEVDETGFLVLGSTRVVHYLDYTRLDKRKERFMTRNWLTIFAVLFILALVLLIGGIVSGQFSEIYNYMKPPWW